MTTDDDRVVRRLERSYDSRPPDELLKRAVAFGHSGLEFPVGLLLAGSIVRGKIAPPGPVGSAADAFIERYMEAFEWKDEARAQVHNSFKSVVADAEASEMKVMAELEKRLGPSSPLNIDDLTVDEVREVVRNKDFIELIDASVQTAGQVVRVTAMRVAASQVSAWWPLTAEPDMDFTFG